MCVCLCSGGLEVTDKSASGSINNSCCPDSALTINTPAALCCQGGVNSWVDNFTFRQHLGTSEAGRGTISSAPQSPFCSRSRTITNVPRVNPTAFLCIDFTMLSRCRTTPRLPRAGYGKKKRIGLDCQTMGKCGVSDSTYLYTHFPIHNSHKHSLLHKHGEGSITR